MSCLKFPGMPLSLLRLKLADLRDMLLSQQCLELAEPPRHGGQHELAVLALRLDALEDQGDPCSAPRRHDHMLLGLPRPELAEAPGHAAEPAALRAA